MHHGLVAEYNGVQFMGQRKYDMEIVNGQKLFFSFFKPSFPRYLLAFGTMSITAGMIHDALRTAVIAAFYVAAQVGGAAVVKIGYDLEVFRP